VRLGLVVAEGREAQMARLAEEHGLFGVLAGAGDPLTAINAAVYASTATHFVRVVVRVRLGLEHPVTIAEELSILDNVNNGRTVVLADCGHLHEDSAADELAVMREALASRPIQHEGPRWKVPAGLPANVTAPKSISVTPKPAQLEIPFWLTGPHTGVIGAATGLPVLAREPDAVENPGLVQPALTAIQGLLKPDREHVSVWAATGATHLLLELPEGAELEQVMTMVSRHLAPEVLMPHFPRVMSESRIPLAWPGADGGREID
jgi:alkanesulfonate monooxygenase SsuD/methylene tetrahydromethanopterin reductase-like flavin-dependent oxidoreductase (luciferase family)